MTQRLKHCPNTLNLETIACEKYMSRLLQREKSCAPTMKPASPSVGSQKYREKILKQAPATALIQNQLSKIRPNVKQQNIASLTSQSPTRNVLQYTDDSALVEVTVKTTNPRQRSRSTADEREPWGQLLKQQKSSEKVSVFSNFDPLRTLHFLAKELQYQLQAALPDDDSIQQMVADMQYALKRVPPEVASTIHLQQAIDMLPNKKSSQSLDDEKPEKLKPSVSERTTQTPPSTEKEQNEKLQKVMEESTIKLEEGCRHLENLCGQLKTEKESLEKQLKLEKDSVSFFKKRLEDVEFENTEIYCPKIKKLEEEKRKLELEINELSVKLDTKCAASTNELKTLMNELKTSKTLVEQECTKLKHQLRLSAIEKEKFVAILAVRDRQINEIRSEMTQLQEVVNDQLMELHNNAFACMPTHASLAGKNSAIWKMVHNKENVGDVGDVGDASLSTIHSSVGPVAQFFSNKQSSFQDIPSGDIGSSNVLQEVPDNYFEKNGGYIPKDAKTRTRIPDPSQYLERQDSQASIRSMFSEIKKTAYAVANTPRNRSQTNFSGVNRQ